MNFNGKIRLNDDLLKLAVITRISNVVSGKEQSIRGYATLLPHQKIAQENVLLTPEAILTPITVKSFMERNPDTEFSIFIRDVLGEILSQESPMFLSHAQTDESEFTVFIVVNPILNVQWFTTLNDEKFNTFIKELRRFKESKKSSKLENFSVN